MSHYTIEVKIEIWQTRTGKRNLSTKNRLRDRPLSLKYRQVTRQGFLRAKFETGKQISL
jgi:hypothetical protein